MLDFYHQLWSTFFGGKITSTINKANLTLSTSDVVKTYDGNSSALGLLTATGLVGGDTATGGSFAFTNKNAGTGNKTVTTSAATVGDGYSGGNYNVSYADNTTSTINKAILTVTGTWVDKTYDGTTAATVIYSGNTVAGDELLYSGKASFASKNAGSSVPISVTSFTVSGTDAGNYSFNPSVTVKGGAAITPAPLYASINPYIPGVIYVGFASGDNPSDITGARVGLASISGNYAPIWSFNLPLLNPNYLSIGGMLSLVDFQLCLTQLDKGTAGCATDSSIDAMARRLAATAAENDQ